jgi:TM2 domain-containing membrane protein YozV
MKKSMKAALLSAFLFPGVGHIYLKRYIPGMVLVGVSLAGIYYLTSKTVERSLQIVEKIQSGDVPLDVTAITELVSKQPTGTEAQLLDIATTVIIICWLIGIIDSYRVGRGQDKNKQVLMSRKT